jgi:hypothetical protein
MQYRSENDGTDSWIGSFVRICTYPSDTRTLTFSQKVASIHNTFELQMVINQVQIRLDTYAHMSLASLAF